MTAFTFTQAETAIRAYIEAQWALSAYSTLPLVWENEDEPEATVYLAINIEGVRAYKSVYGSVGKRVSEEDGIVFIHCFGEEGTGKTIITAPIDAMNQILELKTLSGCIDLFGANPPSPVYHSGDEDFLESSPQPGGQYYRCTGSVPFTIRGTR